MKRIERWIACVTCLAAVGSAQATLVETEDPSFPFQPILEARFRSFRPTGGQEIYLGFSDVGCPRNRTATDVPWISGTHPIEFVYDPISDLLRATAVVQDAVYAVEFNGVTTRLAASDSGWNLGDLNALRVELWDRDGNGSQSAAVRLSDLRLNGQTIQPTDAEETTTTWWVSGLDLGKGFTVTGNLELSGKFSSRQELSKLEMEIGHAEGTYSPVPEAPAVWAGLPLLLWAAVARWRRQTRST